MTLKYSPAEVPALVSVSWGKHGDSVPADWKVSVDVDSAYEAPAQSSTFSIQSVDYPGPPPEPAPSKCAATVSP